MRWGRPPSQRLLSALSATALTNHSAETAGDSSQFNMNGDFRIVQLNVRKRGEVHESLMNDEGIEFEHFDHLRAHVAKEHGVPLRSASQVERRRLKKAKRRQMAKTKTPNYDRTGDV